MKKPLHVTIPIAKVDEEQRMVYGYATVEELDSHGEVITYEASKKAFSSWIGNIREMHKEIAVGKNMETEFDDDAKGIWIGCKISESDDGEQAWIKVKEGVYAGFSIGGAINDAEVRTMAVDGKKTAVTVITDYDLGEVSLVDSPAAPSAIFQMVKSVGGKLQEVEEIHKGPGRPVAWFERAFKFSDSQKIMKGAVMSYTEDSMGSKKQSLAKSIWEADMLIDLAQCLTDYIYWKSWEGEDMTELKGALDTIKQAAAGELAEPENFPEVEAAIENATKALNIKKSEELTKMSTDRQDRTKSVTGSEVRDADANVVLTDTDLGRPVNDTEERALEAGVPVAGSSVEQDEVGEDGKPTGKVETITQPLVNAEGERLVEVDDEGNPVTQSPDANAVDPKPESETPAPDADAAADADADEPKPAEDGKSGGKGKGKKYAPVTDLKKSSDSDLVKMISSAVESGIAKAVEPLKEEIAELKKQPAASKVRKTYTVAKGADVDGNQTPGDGSQEDKLRQEFDELNKRAEELSKDASVGTPEERTQVAFKLRKLSRQLDPASVAKHAAIRATFNTAQ